MSSSPALIGWAATQVSPGPHLDDDDGDGDHHGHDDKGEDVDQAHGHPGLPGSHKETKTRIRQLFKPLLCLRCQLEGQGPLSTFVFVPNRLAPV